MENKKTLGVYPVIHNNKIQSLRSFLNTTQQMYEYQKTNLNNNDFVSYLKNACYDIEVQINSTNDYYQSNTTTTTEIREALEKCENLSILFLKYIAELNELGIDKNEYLSFRKESKGAFDFDLDPKKKKPIDNYLEITKQFDKILASIKIETSTYKTNPYQTTNPYPEIFKGFDNTNYLLFKKYTEKYIIDKYADYSFIIQKMKKDENRILKQLTHLEIMKWLKEHNFINDKDYEIFISKGSFATQYLNKADRINNYNLTLKELFPNSLD